jgi:hypothetical protein
VLGTSVAKIKLRNDTGLEKLTMATLCFFDETINDQDGKTSMSFEVGRSSYYDEDSLYMVIDGKAICINRATATKICAAFEGVATYLQLR